jgi:hypothetical protein
MCENQKSSKIPQWMFKNREDPKVQRGREQLTNLLQDKKKIE